MKKALAHSNIAVKKSPIHGYGVFAVEDIPEGAIIEECYALKINQHEKEVLVDYTFSAGEYFWLVLGNGSIYNHSNVRNAKYEFNIENCLVVFSALRPIKKGEEIFISYGENWFSSRRMAMKEPSRWFKFKRYWPLLNMLMRFFTVVGAIWLSVVILNSFKTN